jgi:hypothetical protein
VLVLNSRQFLTFTLLSLQQTGCCKDVELDVVAVLVVLLNGCCSPP